MGIDNVVFNVVEIIKWEAKWLNKILIFKKIISFKV